MAMKDLKQKKKSKSESTLACCPDDDSLYPWGLRLDLNQDTLETIGASEIPAVGETVEFTAKAKVIGVRMRDDRDGKDTSVELQITAIDLPFGEESDDAEE